MSHTMKCMIPWLICVFVAAASGVRAADNPVPDDLTLNVGEVAGVGTNVTLVLKKRSIRSDTYALVLETADGHRQMDPFPVRTYRGHVKDDPIVRVNANIEPSGVLNANFSEGRDLVGQIVGLKIDIPPGPSLPDGSRLRQGGQAAEGTESTPMMSAGNSVVPWDKARERQASTRGGYRLPRYPMRRARFTVNVENDYMERIGNDIEQAVVEAEQRINAADFVYARDIGVAWELNTLIIKAGGADLSKYPPLRDIAMASPERQCEYRARFWCRRNVFAAGEARVAGTGGTSASVLLHEVGHAFGTSHHLDCGDCMQGCREFIGPHNTQVMLWGVENSTSHVPIIYSGVLPPRAMEDFANTRKDQAATIDVLENDYDGNGDELFLQSADPKSAKDGTLLVSEDRKQVFYTPPPDFVGQDHFTYTVVDSTGAGSRTGSVKVDVRTDGLASHFSFETARITEVPLRRGRVRHDYYFPDMGPYGAEACGSYVEHLVGQGISGSSVLCRGHAFGQVNAAVGDPGRWSLSVSVWVLYTEDIGPAGVVIEKGGVAYSFGHDFVQSGWAIGHGAAGKGFKFMGNMAYGRPAEHFSLQSDEQIVKNRWYHLVMVMDREAKKLRAYVNNKEVLKSFTTPSIPDGLIEYWTPLRLYNAIVWKKGGWQAFPAIMDEVKIFTSALTPEQVAELYAEGKDAPAPDFRELPTQ